MKDGGMGKFEIPTAGPVEINGIMIKTKDGKAAAVNRIRKIVEVG